MITNHSLSVVIPVYNEEGIIEKMLRDYHNEIIKKFERAETIIVNDCSKDKTLEILKKIEKELNLTIVNLPVNSGHGRALRAGLDLAVNDLVFHTDSDYQHDPKDFWKLYGKLEGNDLVLGYRHSRMDSTFRKTLTKIVRFANILLFGVYLKDANIPFKIYKKDVLKKIMASVDPKVLAPSILINIIAARSGYKIGEVPVSHFDRQTGKVSIVRWKLLKFCYAAFFELLSLRKIPCQKSSS